MKTILDYFLGLKTFQDIESGSWNERVRDWLLDIRRSWVEEEIPNKEVLYQSEPQRGGGWHGGHEKK
jgi:hypothetical protein